MEYFTLCEDRYIENKVQIGQNLRESGKNTYFIDKIDVIFTDFMMVPRLTVSDKVMRILKKYDPKLQFENITLVDTVNRQLQLYWYMQLEEVTSLSKEAVQDKFIFLWNDNPMNKKIVVNLRVLESLLRRGCTGYTYERIDFEKI